MNDADGIIRRIALFGMFANNERAFVKGPLEPVAASGPNAVAPGSCISGKRVTTVLAPTAYV